MIFGTSGLEGYVDDPVKFFSRILCFPQLTEAQQVILEAVADGRRLQVGLVHDGDEEDPISVASFICGMVLWRAFSDRRPTLLWGGRRSMAKLWSEHLVTLAASTIYLPRLRMEIGDSGPIGVKAPQGWLLRYDGPFQEDSEAAAMQLSGRVDVLLGDFRWTSKDSITRALDIADEKNGIAITLLNDC